MRALLIVDMQNDFMPGGSLAVPDAELLIPGINAMIGKFKHVIASQDWHPKQHSSFKSNSSEGIWPEHCVQDSYGAEFAPGLDQVQFSKVIQKGMNPQIDSYSAFFDNDHKSQTGLDSHLKERGIDELYICGVATDYCVKWSVLDALELGYQVYLIQDLCAGINLQNDDCKKAFNEMHSSGAKIVQSSEID